MSVAPRILAGDGQRLSAAARHEAEYAWGGTLDFCFDTMPTPAAWMEMYYIRGICGHGVAWQPIWEQRRRTDGRRPGRRTKSLRECSLSARRSASTTASVVPAFAGAYCKVLDWIQLKHNRVTPANVAGKENKPQVPEPVRAVRT
jgi:hypothetical protein